MTIQQLAGVAKVILEKFAAAGSAVARPSHLARVTGGAERVAEFVGRQVEEVTVVMTAIVAAIAAGVTDEWGEKGSPFRTALVAELRKVVAETPKPPKEADKGLKFRVASMARDMKHGVGAFTGQDPAEDLNIDDRSIDAIVDQVTRRNPSSDNLNRVISETLTERSEGGKLFSAIHGEAKIRGLRVVRGDEKVGNGINTPLFNSIVGTVSYGMREADMALEEAVKAAFDAKGLVGGKTVAPPPPAADNGGEIDLGAADNGGKGGITITL